MRAKFVLILVWPIWSGLTWCSLGHISNSSTNSSTQTNYFWNMKDYPNPIENPFYCHRRSESFLCDPDDLLTLSQANTIDARLHQMGNSSKCFCETCPGPPHDGIKVAIALARNIFRPYNTVAGRTESSSQAFADYLLQKWNFGVCGDTLLVLVIDSQYEISFSLGGTAEKILEEDFFKKFIHIHGKQFEDKQYAKGLETLLVEIKDFVENNGSLGTMILTQSEVNQDFTESSHHTSKYVIGVVVGFLFVVSSLMIALFLMKKHYQSNRKLVGDKSDKPLGYWSEHGDHTNQHAIISGQQKSSELSSSRNNIVYEPCSIEDDLLDSETGQRNMGTTNLIGQENDITKPPTTSIINTTSASNVHSQ